MAEYTPTVGRLAHSLAGRDKKRPVVIVEVLDDKFVLVADGRTRKLAKPKKKKLMHLALRPFVDTELAEKSKSGILLDCDVRRFIDAHYPADKEETACPNKTLSK